MENYNFNLNFVKPTLVSRHLYCPICTNVFSNPIRLGCGHVFCERCIQESMKMSSKNCPNCRKKIVKTHMGRDLIAYNIIEDLEIFCPNMGCEWIGSIKNTQIHLDNCPFAQGKQLPSWLQKHLHDKENYSFDPTLDPQTQEKINDLNLREPLALRIYKKMSQNKRDLLLNVPENSSSKEEDEIEQMFAKYN